MLLNQNNWKNPEWLFNKVTGFIFAIILLFTMLAMLIGAFRLFYSLYELFGKTGITGNYMQIFSDVLTLVILLELSRSLFQYFMDNVFRLPIILDAGIVFVLRDIMIGLFESAADMASRCDCIIMTHALSLGRASEDRAGSERAGERHFC